MSGYDEPYALLILTADEFVRLHDGDGGLVHKAYHPAPSSFEIIKAVLNGRLIQTTIHGKVRYQITGEKAGSDE